MFGVITPPPHWLTKAAHYNAASHTNVIRSPVGFFSPQCGYKRWYSALPVVCKSIPKSQPPNPRPMQSRLFSSLVNPKKCSLNDKSTFHKLTLCNIFLHWAETFIHRALIAYAFPFLRQENASIGNEVTRNCSAHAKYFRSMQ